MLNTPSQREGFFRTDHVAICTIHRVNHIVSWNFKHLVNVRRSAGFNAVNLLQGFPPVSIVNPKELIYASSDQDI